MRSGTPERRDEKRGACPLGNQRHRHHPHRLIELLADHAGGTLPEHSPGKRFRKNPSHRKAEGAETGTHQSVSFSVQSGAEASETVCLTASSDACRRSRPRPMTGTESADSSARPRFHPQGPLHPNRHRGEFPDVAEREPRHHGDARASEPFSEV